MPADCSRNTNGAALPSMMGNSGASTSTNALSIPRPANADIRCSTVAIRIVPAASVVAIVVSPTWRTSAGISTDGLTSTRVNTMPVSTGAGRSVTTTFSPVCMPTPVARIVFFNVLWLIIDARYPRLSSAAQSPEARPDTHVSKRNPSEHALMPRTPKSFSLPGVSGKPECPDNPDRAPRWYPPSVRGAGTRAAA